MLKIYYSLLLIVTLSMFAVKAKAQENQFKSISFGDSDTKYSFRNRDGMLIIDAEGQNSASGLFLPNPDQCLNENQLAWSWRVDKIQPTADITIEEKEDFAASIIILFGKPGVFSKPKGLIYAFTNTELEVESVVSSPRAPDNFRTIVLNNQNSPLMNWLTQKRNIIEDYQLVYGEKPDKNLHSIGIFSDNDQTEEAVEASYNLKSCNLSPHS